MLCEAGFSREVEPAGYVYVCVSICTHPHAKELAPALVEADKSPGAAVDKPGSQESRWCGCSLSLEAWGLGELIVRCQWMPAGSRPGESQCFQFEFKVRKTKGNWSPSSRQSGGRSSLLLSGRAALVFCSGLRLIGRGPAALERAICFSPTSHVTQMVKRLPTMRETRARSLGQEDPLEREMATHSSTLAHPIDGGAWEATVHGVAKNRTRLSDFMFTFCFSQPVTSDVNLIQHTVTDAWRSIDQTSGHCAIQSRWHKINRYAYLKEMLFLKEGKRRTQTMGEEGIYKAPSWENFTSLLCPVLKVNWRGCKSASGCGLLNVLARVECGVPVHSYTAREFG